VIAVCGNVNVDISAFIEASENREDNRIKRLITGLGGTAANTAVQLARMGERVVLYCSVGDDVLAGFVRQKLLEENVRSFELVNLGASTGLCFVKISENGERQLFTHRGANDLIKAQDIDKNASILYFAGIRPLDLKEFCEMSDYGRTVVYSPGGIVSFENTGELAEISSMVDHLIVNESEYEQIRQEDKISSRFTVVTLGKEGAKISETNVKKASYFVPVIDTTGAGDAFSAGYLFGVHHCLAIDDCLVLGNIMGALAVSGEGSQGPLSLHDIKRFLREREPVLFSRIRCFFDQ